MSDRPYTLNIIRDEPRTFSAVVCPKCQRVRWNDVGPHAPRHVGGKFVDCSGDEVKP